MEELVLGISFLRQSNTCFHCCYKNCVIAVAAIYFIVSDERCHVSHISFDVLNDLFYCTPVHSG